MYSEDDVAISYQGGVALVSTVGSETWHLMTTCGVALDVPDINGALLWANEQNRRIATGRYYCAIAAQQGMAAIVLEDGLLGPHLDLNHSPSRSLLLSTIFTMCDDAVHSSREVLSTYGGRAFPVDGGEAILAAIRG
jgi:hypothetical protein